MFALSVYPVAAAPPWCAGVTVAAVFLSWCRSADTPPLAVAGDRDVFGEAPTQAGRRTQGSCSRPYGLDMGTAASG